MTEYGRKWVVSRSQEEIKDRHLAKQRLEVIHTGVLHWDYGQKAEDETQERERWH